MFVVQELIRLLIPILPPRNLSQALAAMIEKLSLEYRNRSQKLVFPCMINTGLS